MRQARTDPRQAARPESTLGHVHVGWSPGGGQVVHVSGAASTARARVLARVQAGWERLLQTSGGRWLARRRRPAPVSRPLERLVSDLRRLGAELRWIEHAPVPYRVDRMRALSLAYDCTLLDCCRLLEVDAPGRPPWTPVERLQVESGLAMAGLVW